MKGYVTYIKVAKETLDNLLIGDLVKINDWKKPMKIMGISKDYAVMT